MPSTGRRNNSIHHIKGRARAGPNKPRHDTLWTMESKCRNRPQTFQVQWSAP